jgi:hypothetical protein
MMKKRNSDDLFIAIFVAAFLFLTIGGMIWQAWFSEEVCFEDTTRVCYKRGEVKPVPCAQARRSCEQVAKELRAEVARLKAELKSAQAKANDVVHYECPVPGVVPCASDATPTHALSAVRFGAGAPWSSTEMNNLLQSSGAFVVPLTPEQQTMLEKWARDNLGNGLSRPITPPLPP